jgi:alginate O-acetyltransferase complex protein AlgI
MLFSSLVFIFVFLPIILLSYYLSPRNVRNYILLTFSILFYAWGGVKYTLILIISILINYLVVRQLVQHKPGAKKWLTAGLIFNITLLVVFKYLDFFIDNLNDLGIMVYDNFGSIPNANIILPLGISFFTFQQISMLWDIYRNPENNSAKFINTALYISFFPQLIAGPIVRYNDIIDQIRSRKETARLFTSGIQKFLLGLFKKIVLANSCAAMADAILDSNMNEYTVVVAWLGIVAYGFQIYFDFSGYSDMAIGLGRMFGFRILENFNFPYISTSIKEFWRRWHMSLSSWFRDYVYIPIGGNRQGPSKTYINLMIVFLLTGFWHGATWSFVFWGVFHGLFLIIERLGFDKILNRIPGIFSWIYTMLVVIVGWVYFRIEDFTEASAFVAKLFGFGTSGDLLFVHYIDRERIVILLLAAAASSTLFLHFKKFALRFKDGSFSLGFTLIKDVILVIMLFYSVLQITSGSYNPFIYFRF